MKLNIEVKQLDSDVIEILGVKYCTESYLIEMMRREYERGVDRGVEKGRKIIIHKMEIIDR
jgi:hypothetical protein